MTRLYRPEDFVFCTEQGAGAPVILLHSSASTGQQWQALTEYLDGRFRVIRPDIPGYGKSANAGRDASLETIAQSIIPIIEATGTSAHIVGHSFGGAVALKIATLRPDLVRSLTLIEPAAFNVLWTDPQTDVDHTVDLKAMAQTSRTALAEGDAWTAMQTFIDFWNDAGAWGRTSFKLQQILATFAGVVHRDFDALSGDRLTDRDLAGVACPTLCLFGGQSPAVMRAVAARLGEALPFARTEFFADSGHMLPLTDPHLTDPAIGEFLVRVDRQWQDAAVSTAVAA